VPTVTPVQFTAQLDELRRRGRPLFYAGGAAALLIDLVILIYVVRLPPLYAHGREALTAYLVALVACVPAIVVLHLALRWTVNRYAPACRTCGAKATWKVRSQVLVTGHCPSCDSAFFTSEPRPPQDKSHPLPAAIASNAEA